ncbi:Predicted acyltransferase [Catalinimonas alkaloidigena]|uniref:Predicted acyltransferase n=1 Tax=Catalinimonas alkaloidigena TaxID=1075417 RepID=A0A1G9HUE3_9BACT|nr:DUF5009 domain-containing protein [Catalinimonas alkaloidigena]SDL16193.1 Predicted acyltransferase [Catalinimonas alkaloidigena]
MATLTTQEKSTRFLTLDVFRGMTVCFMIIVNSPGGSTNYAPLLHADWHGFTPTDLVFPSFLFAVGNAMAFSMRKYELQGEGIFWRKLLKRTALIFLLGFLMYWFPFFGTDEAGNVGLLPLSETRILGVLQRIALCYFFGSLIFHYFSKQTAVWIGVGLLIGYWLVMYLFGDAGDPYSLTGNAALKLDLWLMGPDHLYHGEGIPFDPEGALSTLPAIGNVIAGYLTGDYIRRQGNSFETIAKLMLVAAALLVGAWAWDMSFPINKKLWTSSFVLLTSGLDIALIACLIYVVELRSYRRWTSFFLVFGKNPLFIYLLSEFLVITLFLVSVGDQSLRNWIYQSVYLSLLPPIQASLWFALTIMAICWVVGYWLDKRNIYIRV